MSVQEFYNLVGGSYESVLCQLLSEDRVKKYIFKFLEVKSFQNLDEYLKKEDYEKAFLEAHNLKGVSINIGFNDLSEVSSKLTESLRGGPSGNEKELFEEVKVQYEKVRQLISQIDV